MFKLGELLMSLRNILVHCITNEVQLFVGNVDSNELVSRNYFPEPVMAHFIKFYPQKWHIFIALRVELYGCVTGNSSSL